MIETNMKIREVTRFNIKTFNVISRLLSQLGVGKSLTKEHFNAIIQSDSSHLFIAELSTEQIAGMLTIVTFNIPSGRKVLIEDVVVDEAQRGKGFGRELMLFAIDYAKSLGSESIELTSRPSRISANQLYQSLGFVIRETNYYKYLLK